MLNLILYFSCFEQSLKVSCLESAILKRLPEINLHFNSKYLIDAVLTLRQCFCAMNNMSGHRVAELGSLSSGAKMAMEIFVKRVFTIFASNASFLRIIANLQN